MFPIFGTTLSIWEVIGSDAERLNESNTECESSRWEEVSRSQFWRSLWVESEVHLLELKGIP